MLDTIKKRYAAWKARRFWTAEKQVEHALIVIREDSRFLANSYVAMLMVNRYQSVLEQPFAYYEECIRQARRVHSNDMKFIATANPIAIQLFSRYGGLLAEDWYQRPVESASNFRKYIGLEPNHGNVVQSGVEPIKLRDI